MPFSQELVDELNVLMRFSLTSMQEGIKCTIMPNRR